MKKLKVKEAKYFIGMKMRIYPSTKQKQIIKKNSDLSRFVYNEYVSRNKTKAEITKILNESTLTPEERIGLQNQLDEIKRLNSNPTNLERIIHWMGKDKEIDPQTKYLALKSYKAAWNMWRKVSSSKSPVFKRKNPYKWSYSTSECKILDTNHIHVNKLDKVRCRGMRKAFLHDELYIGRTTITKDNDDKYYLSVQLGSKIPFIKKQETTNSSVGIDLNTSNFLTDSNGNVISNPRFHKKSLRRLAKKQRLMSRKQRAAKRENRDTRLSKKYQEARISFAKEHKKVKNQRENFLQNVANIMVKNHDIIICEDLKINNMIKNRSLARSIADVSWGRFMAILDYKTKYNDKTFLRVNPAYTTQTCNDCNYVMSGDEKIQLGVERWACPNCGVIHSRDHNAAKNILNKGLELIQAT